MADKNNCHVNTLRAITPSKCLCVSDYTRRSTYLEKYIQKSVKKR